MRHFEYNQGAGRLYERLGFKVEGVSRQEIWHKGRWWDGIQLGMLSEEWAELKQKRENHS